MCKNTQNQVPKMCKFTHFWHLMKVLNKVYNYLFADGLFEFCAN